MCEIDDRAVWEDCQEMLEEATMRAYLDGLLKLPLETLKILQQMEEEKRGER